MSTDKLDASILNMLKATPFFTTWNWEIYQKHIEKIIFDQINPTKTAQTYVVDFPFWTIKEPRYDKGMHEFCKISLSNLKLLFKNDNRLFWRTWFKYFKAEDEYIYPTYNMKGELIKNVTQNGFNLNFHKSLYDK